MKKHYTIVGGMVVIAALATLPNIASLVCTSKKETSAARRDFPTSLSTSIPTGSTLTSIQGEIAKREYSITYDSAHHALQSPNRRHNLRAYYRPGNLTIQNRIDSAGQNFRMQLVNKGIYADEMLIAAAEPDAALDNGSDTLRITHKGFTEEFINNQEGIRQNFIIFEAPTHTRRLSVRLSARGLHARQQDDDHLVFYSNDEGQKTDRLTYSDLKCWDANGKSLTAGISISKGQIELNVNVDNVAYPVTIDPIIANGNPANADKTLEINQTSAWLGFSVSTAGDINGDGYSDLIVGAHKYTNGQTEEGAAMIYYGSINGIVKSAFVTIEGNVPYQLTGFSVSDLQDVNGDGYGDVIIGGCSNLPGKGSVMSLHGNDGENVKSLFCLYNSADLTTPINHTQFPQNNFGAGLFAKSFTGRNKGKLIWETKPLAQGFSKGSNNRITNSTQSTGSQNAYSDLGATGFELKM